MFTRRFRADSLVAGTTRFTQRPVRGFPCLGTERISATTQPALRRLPKRKGPTQRQTVVSTVPQPATTAELLKGVEIAAKRYYLKSNGCFYCCRPCHTT